VIGAHYDVEAGCPGASLRALEHADIIVPWRVGSSPMMRYRWTRETPSGLPQYRTRLDGSGGAARTMKVESVSWQDVVIGNGGFAGCILAARMSADAAGVLAEQAGQITSRFYSRMFREPLPVPFGSSG
jgi:hypothetical protein